MRFLLWLLIGLIVGHLAFVPVTTQSPALAFGIDSVSGLVVPIQTDGANALKVTGK